MRVTYMMVAQVPPAGVEQFQQYEARVLPLLADHGGRMERRLRSADERTEVHLVTFPSVEAFRGYRDDPRRAQHRQLLAESKATQDVFELYEVSPDG